MWIEIVISAATSWDCRSRPARALWIEILTYNRIVGRGFVEAREGLVD